MKQQHTFDETPDWMQYEVRRHVVAELESLLGAGAGPPVPSSNAGTGVVEESLPAPGVEHGRLAQKNAAEHAGLCGIIVPRGVAVSEPLW